MPNNNYNNNGYRHNSIDNNHQHHYNSQPPPTQPPLNQRYYHQQPHPPLNHHHQHNRIPHPGRPSNGVTRPDYLEPNSPYRRGGANINRSKSLTRPERQRPRTNMINAHEQHDGNHPRRRISMLNQQRATLNQPMSNQLQAQLAQQKEQQQQQQQQQQPSTPLAAEEKPKEEKVLTNWWAWTAYLATCCFPSYIIRVWFGKSNKSMQQAWREKVTLCYLIAFLCGLLAYVIYGLTVDLCPSDYQSHPYSSVNSEGVRVPLQREEVYVFGQIYKFDVIQQFFDTQHLNFTKDFQGMEIGPLFNGDTKNDCAAYMQGSSDPTLQKCTLTSPYGTSITPPSCIPLNTLHKYSNSGSYLSFDWEDIHAKNSDLAVIVNTIVNMSSYLQLNEPVFGLDIDHTIRSTLGNDMTYSLLYTEAGKNARRCLLARYSVGTASQQKSSCIADNIIMTVMFAVIIIIIVIRYTVAVLFTWIVSRSLVKPGGRAGLLAWRSVKGGNDIPANHIPGPYNNYPPMVQNFSSPSIHGQDSSVSSQNSNDGLRGVRTDIVDTELYTVMLVTCYSEGEEGLRTTMDSLSNTTYSKKHKIFFVIADGLITGAGESMSTPDIVVNMMDITAPMANPKPCSYLAVADGEKQLNMAKVYAGHYNGTPCITIVKCGTEEEQAGPKPGNRGKRDSQVILMSFFQRVLFNERLCELDYEIFWKMTWLMKGVTPDKFELVLMVDADTQVLPDALTYMVAAMANDITIMGLCGETRIANKRASWVSAIQVFEYYISHHYAKAFEALFGMVTCLPGCFSMYRIKSPKNGAWVPILANPDIIMEYNQNVVTTLHEKNLLLLGEDRFLSTLMLRTFPHRQMMFVPQARCRTVVPDEFKVLLSQRRRWINSTVHNLMELVLVSDLCGISFLSMQFSVFIDLIGTLVLPAAIIMSIYLIVATAVSPNPQWQSLGLLLAILFLPAILIAITTFKLVYICWMIIYICALPIWNFVLPLYSFWHFDDFSWGATRVVVGEKKGDSHGGAEGKFDSSRLIIKKWEDWEAERTGQKVDRKVQLKTPQDSIYDIKQSHAFFKS